MIAVRFLFLDDFSFNMTVFDRGRCVVLWSYSFTLIHDELASLLSDNYGKITGKNIDINYFEAVYFLRLSDWFIRRFAGLIFGKGKEGEINY